MRVHCATVGIVLLLALGLSASVMASPPKSYDVEWVRQFGTSENDSCSGVTIDHAGNVYVCGATLGSLGGPRFGGLDVFAAKYDSAGDLQWIRQFGSDDGDESGGISADALGNVYIAGSTWGSLGGPKVGVTDAFISKCDLEGNVLWTRQLGTGTYNAGHGVSTDGLGNAYISGYMHDPRVSRWGFLGKYDSAGELLWTRQLSSALCNGTGVSADGLGSVYVGGYAEGLLGEPGAGHTDAFLGKYDSGGDLLWIHQLGTGPPDYGTGVSADGLGNAYLCGYTYGSLGGRNAGNEDAFLSKYSSDGDLLWTHQFGTSAIDLSYCVSADGVGNVFVCGETTGSLGTINAGGLDGFVARFDAAGNLAWIHQFGTDGDEQAFGVLCDGLGTVYVTGRTKGSLGGPNAGGDDAFLMKLVLRRETLTGDINQDGAVDMMDLALLAESWLEGVSAPTDQPGEM